jgi:putative peptide zinc metalloprotease protein
VVDRSAATARVVVPQTQADLARRRTEAVGVRLAQSPGVTLQAQVVGEVPSSTARLPSRTLGSQGGGAIAVDARDQAGIKTIDPVFQFDLELPVDASTLFPGSRVYVQFLHGSEPLYRRVHRHLRQLFLARLGL